MAKEIKTEADVKRYCEDLAQSIHIAIIQTLAYCGEVAVRTAREPHPNNWDDHTGNLRSSIGYIITYNGKEVTPKEEMYSAFSERELRPEHKEPVRFTAYKGTEKEIEVSFEARVEAGNVGVEEGKAFAQSQKSEHPQGYALIVVAGMNYADKVEAYGKDVLGYAELKAREWWSKNQKYIPKRAEAIMKRKGW